MYPIFLNLFQKFLHRVLEDDAYIKENDLISLKNDNQIKKVVICSGKIYYDLLEGRENTKETI